MTVGEHESDLKHTTDTHSSPQRTSYGVSVVRIIGENGPCYNRTALYNEYMYHAWPWSQSNRSQGINRNTALVTLRPRQNGRRFTDDIFKCIFLNKNSWIFSNISLKYVFLGPDWQYGSIGSYDGLVSNRQQAIIWTNVGMFYNIHCPASMS